VARKVLTEWVKPFLTLFSDSDPVTRGAEVWFQQNVPGAAGQAHVIVTAAGHFLQEDKGPELAEYVAGFMARPQGS
jgi:haloalkane dehalogenase